MGWINQPPCLSLKLQGVTQTARSHPPERGADYLDADQTEAVPQPPQRFRCRAILCDLGGEHLVRHWPIPLTISPAATNRDSRVRFRRAKRFAPGVSLPDPNRVVRRGPRQVSGSSALAPGPVPPGRSLA